MSAKQQVIAQLQKLARELEETAEQLYSPASEVYKARAGGFREAVLLLEMTNFNEVTSAPEPLIKMSSHQVAVDQNYFWDLNMPSVPNGKVQLLGKGGLPCYGKVKEAPGFYVAWAPLPKLPPHFNPEIFK